MNGIFYRNSATNLPGWIEPVHQEQKYGYAYETDTHFVHFYGRDTGLNIISVGLTAIERKSGSLESWVKRVFGAQQIQPLLNPIGHTIEGIWRPSLYFNEDIQSAINVDPIEQRSAEQALRILIDKLDELLLYIEPDTNGLKTYSHKTRELLILSCTEVENQWTAIFKRANIRPLNNRIYTTNDYVKLLSKAYLKDYVIGLRNYGHLADFRPFNTWLAAQPTQSLTWYDAYNKTKHDRSASFHEATLENVIFSICANIAVFCVRFGPFNLINGNNSLTSVINQHFTISLKDSNPQTYYLPKIVLPENTRDDLLVYDCYREKHQQAWNMCPLTL